MDRCLQDMSNAVMVCPGNARLFTAHGLLCVLIVTVTLPALLHAGAWCIQPGALYVKLSYNHYYTVDTFDNHGSKRHNSEGSYFRDINTTLYAEYGLLDSVTPFTSVPYENLTSRLRYRDNSGRKRHRSYRYHGIGDIDAGMRCSLLRDPFVVSIQVLTKLAWFYDDSEEVLPGNDQNDYELRKKLGTLPVFLFAQKLVNAGVVSLSCVIP